jgi:hypothetical protein
MTVMLMLAVLFSKFMLTMLKIFATDSGLESGYYTYWWEHFYRVVIHGSHSIKIVLDAGNQVTESNESDNQYTRNVTIQHLTGTPLINSITPSTASAGTGSLITITGTNFGAVRGTSKVEFFYQTANPKFNQQKYVSWSNEQIICDVPIGDIVDYPASASSGP